MIRLGSLFGIPITADWSVLIITALLSIQNYHTQVTIAHAGTGVALFYGILTGVGLLVSILAHELGHALTGVAHGMSFSGIILHLFGGVAQFTTQVPSARAEFLVAIAGPIVSIVLGLAFTALSGASADWDAIRGTGTLTPFVLCLVMLGLMNFTLAIFNMIPAFPLDGGRCLRAIIWWVTKNFQLATRVACDIGILCGGLFIATGVFAAFGMNTPVGVGIGSGIWIAIIGWFIIVSARKEKQIYA